MLRRGAAIGANGNAYRNFVNPSPLRRLAGGLEDDDFSSPARFCLGMIFFRKTATRFSDLL
jgi:hypothetical protein